MPAPIIVFAYNRKEHLVRTLEALSRNIGASDSNLFIFADKYKDDENKEDVQKVNSVREYLEEFQKSNVFLSVTITYAKTHKGLASSVISGVTSIIEEYGSVIVLEDDIVTSNIFLQYMNEALEFYESKEKIWSISGYTLPLKSLENYNKDVYLFYRCCSWGWATWKDRWIRNDWAVLDYCDFKKSMRKRSRFNRGGNDLSFMMDRQMLGMIDSWATRWGYRESVLDMYTIYPSVSYVDNTGCDGSGTHFANKSNRYITELSDKGYQLCMPELNENIVKEFHDRHSEPLLKHAVKELLYHFGLYKVK